MAVTSLTRNTIKSPTKYSDFLAGNSQYDVSSMIPIATWNANGTDAGVLFSNIPQGYQDLFIVGYGRDTRAVTAENFLIKPNNDGSALYSYTLLQGDGASATSSRATGLNFGVGFYALSGANATAGIYGSGTHHILNYANSTTYKTMVSRGAADLNGSGYTAISVNLWRSTVAISSLWVGTYNALLAGSTITLYGIKAVGQ